MRIVCKQLQVYAQLDHLVHVLGSKYSTRLRVCQSNTIRAIEKLKPKRIRKLHASIHLIITKPLAACINCEVQNCLIIVK